VRVLRARAADGSGRDESDRQLADSTAVVEARDCSVVLACSCETRELGLEVQPLTGECQAFGVDVRGDDAAASALAPSRPSAHRREGMHQDGDRERWILREVARGDFVDSCATTALAVPGSSLPTD